MAQQATVLLRNLNEASTHASVAAALAEFGPVKRVDVIRGRGFGFVKFATAADAQKAVRAGRDHGIDVDGSVVEVALARELLEPGELVPLVGRGSLSAFCLSECLVGLRLRRLALNI